MSILKDALAVGLQQSVSRFTLWLSCHGLVLPWYAWAESHVPASTLERYRRRAMISKLRAQRFKFTYGPFFLRPVFEKIFLLIRLLQFPVLLSGKLIGAIFLCLLPFVIFFFVRVYLPVPQRLPREPVDVRVNTFDTAEVLYPNVLRLSQLNSNTSDPQDTDQFYQVRWLDHRSGEAVLIQGKGGAHEESWRGWRLAAEEDLLVSFPVDQTQRMLRLKFKSIPSRNESLQCRIDVMTDVGQVVFASMFSSVSRSGNRFLKTPLTRRLQEKLMPDLAQYQASLQSSPMIIPVAAGAPSLRFKVSALNDGDARACHVLLHGFEWLRKAPAPPRSVKKSVILVLFKSMNYEFALDEKTMPWLSSILQSPKNLVFTQHHALDIRDHRTFQSLLGQSGLASSVNPNSDLQLIERARRNGYKVVLIGDLGSPEIMQQLLPDIAIRIGNDTYQTRLAMKQLVSVLENELTTPAVIILRLNGLQMPWWPAFQDLDFEKIFLGGEQRGIMDTILAAHGKSLDREISYTLDALRKNSVFSKMDLIVTAERGMDLGLGLSKGDSQKATFTSDLLLNQESLKVPLFYIPASSSPFADIEGSRFVQTVTTHQDLTRTLWESLGITDAKFPVEARRLWRNSIVGTAPDRLTGFGVKDITEQMKSYPLQSRLQEGVLFSDPDSTGGFLKYVSQAVPAQISVPDAYGWPNKHTLVFPAGEQFRQVSRRGAREEVLGRVNSRFVRESRKVIRNGRRYPLRFRLDFPDSIRVDLSFEAHGRNASNLQGVIPEGLQLSQRKISETTYIHRFQGTVSAGSQLELSGNLSQLRLLENQSQAALVACPEAFVFSTQALNAAMMQKTICLLEAPELQRLTFLRSKGRKLISVWLVEDEKKVCDDKNGNDSEGTEDSECSQ